MDTLKTIKTDYPNYWYLPYKVTISYEDNYQNIKAKINFMVDRYNSFKNIGQISGLNNLVSNR